MSLGRLLHKGLGMALDAPLLRILAGDVAGHLIAGTAGPAYQAFHDHFTLSGRDLAEALSDSFSCGLAAIDGELNGWRISNAFASRLRRDYQARVLRDFLDPFAEERSLDETARRQLCRSLRECSARLIEARDTLFPSSEMPEPEVAELLAADAGGVSELLIERIEQVQEPLPEDLRAFLSYRDLLGDAVLYFFRETLRRDDRVKATLDALQLAGLRQETRRIDERVAELHQQHGQLQTALTEAIQARDREQRNELMDQIDRLDDLLDDVRCHRQRLETFQQQFVDWSAYLDIRLDDLQQALVGEICQVGERVQDGFAEVGDQLDQHGECLQEMLDLLRAGGLGERIQARDDVYSHSPELLRRIEQTADILGRSPKHRARAAIIKGSVLAAAGDSAQAEQSLHDALAAAQTDAERALAHYNLFQVHLHRGPAEYDKALAALHEAIALDSNHALWRTDKYRVERILGAGGMGCAFLASKLDGHRRVVLKTLWDEDPASAELFYREAVTLARVAGGVVPEPYDFDYADPAARQRPYIEMEYLADALDGEAWLAQHGPLSRDDGLHVGVQIARGLALAHEQGICHFDLKPANLLLRRVGDEIAVRIIDFGLSSSVLDLQRRLGKSRHSGKSTFARAVFGTLDYAPPEQQGDEHCGPPGPRSDLYGFGATLYRLMTGDSPRLIVLEELPEITELRLLIRDCLRPDPARRPENAAEVVDRLESLLADPIAELAPSPEPVPEPESTQSSEFPAPAVHTRPNLPPIQNIHGWPAEKVQALQRQTAEALGLPVVFRDRLRDGSEGPEMVVIPAGTFLMGSPDDEERSYDDGEERDDDEEERDDDERQHEVTIEQPFAIGKYPVTFDEYDRFCEAMIRDKPSDKKGLIFKSSMGRGRRPVINVNWYEAMAYCLWLSEQTGQAYRLLSEAEWEYACRAGTVTPFHFGETISTEQANYAGHYFAYGNGVKGENRKQTTPVGQFQANAWGLHDLHGNVEEWTGSEYDENYTGPEQWLLAADAADNVCRVLRGGSWGDDPWGVRSANRDWLTPDLRLATRGFRLARSLQAVS